MATKTFGPQQTEPRDYVAELHELAGVNFPIEIATDGYKLISVKYETTWKQGTTNPVETDELDERGNPVIDYEENYSNEKLSAAQIKKIDAWIKDNIEA